MTPEALAAALLARLDPGDALRYRVTLIQNASRAAARLAAPVGWVPWLGVAANLAVAAILYYVIDLDRLVELVIYGVCAFAVVVGLLRVLRERPEPTPVIGGDVPELAGRLLTATRDAYVTARRGRHLLAHAYAQAAIVRTYVEEDGHLSVADPGHLGERVHRLLHDACDDPDVAPGVLARYARAQELVGGNAPSGVVLGNARTLLVLGYMPGFVWILADTPGFPVGLSPLIAQVFVIFLGIRRATRCRLSDPTTPDRVRAELPPDLRHLIP
ncbi:hypothetical protein Afil01_18070 [Actinorhabdospora filicis]|uniref:Uncharacterized protein n=1 Tax=Actinorhabdospora filicis TaxID=1785913 RepID=A0A9W6W9V4_9ACTN|nr:hypothetical protein [Actinorhabdospora filicis]GLZ77000.1 hypothetical protein Afil01_18070 [Actinorhabdospora filicis]